MPELPAASNNQDGNLCDTVPNCPRVRYFTQVSVICLPLSLVLLLSPDVFEFLVQIPQLRGKFADVGSIVFAVWFRATDHDVEV